MIGVPLFYDTTPATGAETTVYVPSLTVEGNVIDGTVCVGELIES